MFEDKKIEVNILLAEQNILPEIAEKVNDDSFGEDEKKSGMNKESKSFNPS
jgi:hypothetical protein